MEAEFGKDKLLPARLQKVAPPDAFEAIQSADLIGWDGAVGGPRLQEFLRLVCKRLGRPAVAPTDLIEEPAELPPVKPLPEIAPTAPAPTPPAHDYAFWGSEWEKLRTGTDLIALQAMAAEAPRYFADQARARIAEIGADKRAGGTTRGPIGRKLNEQLGIGAQHALYGTDGRWYEHLEGFPGVLFDPHGYIVFNDKHSYENCPQLRRGRKLNVTGGISSIPGYVRDTRIASLLR